MSTLIIPMVDAGELGAFFLTTELNGSSYRLNFQYNSREDFWYFDILDSEGNQIRSGIKVVVNYPLLRLAMMRDRPPGELLGIDTRAIPVDPTLLELGVDVLFAYEEP